MLLYFLHKTSILLQKYFITAEVKLLLLINKNSFIMFKREGLEGSCLH